MRPRKFKAMKAILLIHADDQFSQQYPFRSSPSEMKYDTYSIKRRMEMECQNAASSFVFTSLSLEISKVWLQNFFGNLNLNVEQIDRWNVEERMLERIKAFQSKFVDHKTIIIVYSDDVKILNHVDQIGQNSIKLLYLVEKSGLIKTKSAYERQELDRNEQRQRKYHVQDEFKKRGLDSRKVTRLIIDEWYESENKSN